MAWSRAYLTIVIAASLAPAIAARAAPKAAAVADSPEVKQLLADLDSADERTRARASRRLFDLRDPRALEANLKTLDDASDPMHMDVTPSVNALIALGRPALAPLYDRLSAPAEMTRRRATNAILGITQRLFGRDVMKGWSTGAESRWYVWWSAIGYRPDGDEAARNQAIARLRAWRAP